MSVCGILNTGAPYDCNNRVIGGIEQDQIYLFNIDDVDYENTVINRDSDTNIHNVSDLQFLSATPLYAFEGINNKSILSAGYTVEQGDYGDYLIHTITVAIYNQCEESLALLNKFVAGARVGAIVENKGKGSNNVCAYNIYGLEYGLYSTELTYNSNENNGIITLTLSSSSISPEPYVPYAYLETDYATTTTKIDSLVA